MAFYVSYVVFKDPKRIFGHACIAITETDGQSPPKMIFRAGLYRGSQVQIEDFVVPKSGRVFFHKTWPVSGREMASLLSSLNADRRDLSESTHNLEKLRRELGSASCPGGPNYNYLTNNCKDWALQKLEETGISDEEIRNVGIAIPALSGKLHPMKFRIGENNIATWLPYESESDYFYISGRDHYDDFTPEEKEAINRDMIWMHNPQTTHPVFATGEAAPGGYYFSQLSSANPYRSFSIPVERQENSRVDEVIRQYAEMGSLTYEPKNVVKMTDYPDQRHVVVNQIDLKTKKNDETVPFKTLHVPSGEKIQSVFLYDQNKISSVEKEEIFRAVILATEGFRELLQKKGISEPALRLSGNPKSHLVAECVIAYHQIMGYPLQNDTACQVTPKILKEIKAYIESHAGPVPVERPSRNIGLGRF